MFQMAASFYKWLAIPVLGLISLSFTKDVAHPFHVSVTEINHNEGDKTLEVSCKIFTDDFEKALAQRFKTRVDLGKDELHSAMDSLIKKYISAAILIRPSGRATSYNYIGYELDKEAAYCYFEVQNVSSVSSLDITNTILYDLFDDQMNIMHVSVKGERKSDKVNYPAKDLKFTF
jgi:hypothetical protein